MLYPVALTQNHHMFFYELKSKVIQISAILDDSHITKVSLFTLSPYAFDYSDISK